MDKSNIWFITPKTNLHVGNENTSSYGLIDLSVQRNATTGLPCINSSSLKGALNEYAAQEAKMASEDLIRIFGSDKVKENGKSRNSDTKKGLYTFFDANILFLPKQSKDSLYELVTCEAVLQRFFSQMKMITNLEFTEADLTIFKYKKLDDDIKIDTNNKNPEEIKKEKHQMAEKMFINLCSDDNLPIIARNVLENGESKNLWYEQVIPAETVFYTIIDDTRDLDEKENKKRTLANIISQENVMVQIGANATIGYGYCKFTNLN